MNFSSRATCNSWIDASPGRIVYITVSVEDESFWIVGNDMELKNERLGIRIIATILRKRCVADYIEVAALVERAYGGAG